MEEREAIPVRLVGNEKTVPQMLGEFLREVAVLALVFVPLELYLYGKISVAWIVGVVVMSAGALAGGIWLEQK